MNMIKLLLTTLVFFGQSPAAFAQTSPTLNQAVDSKNFVNNGGFENGIAGWKAYKDAAGATPVDGTGGSPTTTITVSTSSPISDKASGLLTHPASNAQGEGSAIDFVVDRSALAKVITIYGSYEVVSGTYSGGTSSTDSDVEVYIYDKDAAAVIQPAGYKLDGSVAGNIYTFAASFQSNITSTNYRLIFHNATTATSAFQLRYDNVRVGLQTRSQGPPLIDPVSYTPTISAGFGTSITTGFKYSREGKWLIVDGYFTAGSVAGSLASITLPPGLSIDTTVFNRGNTNAQNGHICGDFSQNSSGNSGHMVTATASDATVVYFGGILSSASAEIPQNGNSVAATGGLISLWLRVPILQWSSTVTMSDSADSRVVAFSATANGVSVGASMTNVTMASTLADTHGGFNGTTTYTIQVPGYYELSVDGVFNPVTGTGGTGFVQINKNGTIVGKQGSIALTTSGQNYQAATQSIVQCNSGDTITLQANQNAGVSVTLTSTLNIKRLSGPSQIAASESVSFRAYRGAAQTGINTNNSQVKMTYNTVSYDTHGGFNTTTNTYTVPVSGTYVCNAADQIQATNVLTSIAALHLIVNGADTLQGTFLQVSTASQVYGPSISAGPVKFLAGDALTVNLYSNANNSGSTLSSSGGATTDWFGCYRVGN